MSIIVKAGKAAKKVLNGAGLIKDEHRVTYVRRIEKIKTDKRICAMTFDDGPMSLCAPGDKVAVSAHILNALARFGAHATFDIVGDTSENYPDKAGALGSAAWGGVRFDHYPDINADEFGGAVHAPELVRRMIDEGHELANHGYRHIIFGKKPFVYGRREHFNSIYEVARDLTRLHNYVKDNFGYEMKLSRPPHYVDKISAGLTSYDAYALMNYGYVAASHDGGGWLPERGEDAYAREVMKMTDAIRVPLENNPDFFSGKIIFGKDGYNMAKRTPVVHALEKQLELLYNFGYTVVSVSELMAESPFADTGRECDILDELSLLSKTNAVAYSDNTLRLDKIMTNYEYAMLVCPKEIAVNERIEKIAKGAKYISEYDAALKYAKENGIIGHEAKGSEPVKELSDKTSAESFTRYEVLKRSIRKKITV